MEQAYSTLQHVAHGGYVVRCDREACPLHPYRLGKMPARAGIGGRPRQ